MPDLVGVMLDDSWVLGWQQYGDSILFNIEASLWPPHPAYEPPRPSEWTCYKRAQLVFEGVTHIGGLHSMSEALQTTDPDGGKDYGNIESFTASHHGFHIAGDFGSVEIRAHSCRLVIESAVQQGTPVDVHASHGRV